MLSFKDYVEIACEVKASDIHICSGYPASMRVDGGVVQIREEILTADECRALAKEIMNENLIHTLDTLGEVDFAYALSNGVRLRMNVYRQNNSVALCGRILNNKIFTPYELGLPSALVDIRDKKRGLVLITGITGSGKSTTLASLVNSINERYNYHIITIEEPIEYIYPKGRSIVNQREIGVDSNSFSNALRAALRQDPDVILVGEMRDLETMGTAISAAETGHLVLSTLHTISATGAVERIIDGFPTHQQQQIRSQLADVIECIMSQQLLPKADGKGRALATELMLATSAIRSHIREGKTYQIPNDIISSKKKGMMLMDESIMELYMRGIISSTTALQYAMDKEAMQAKVF